jgi:hypothetical protein
MNQERRAGEVAPDSDPREENGTGSEADEEQLGITEEEVEDLEDDAKGG